MDAPTSPTRSRRRSIFVPLSGDTIEALQVLAQRDDRTVKGQAAHLIRRGLEAEGLLAEHRPGEPQAVPS